MRSWKGTSHDSHDRPFTDTSLLRNRSDVPRDAGQAIRLVSRRGRALRLLYRWGRLGDFAMSRRVNWAMLPFIVLIRIPILTPFFFVAWVGRCAQKAGDWLARHIPGMDRR